MTLRTRIALAVVLLTAACKAGPSAFSRSSAATGEAVDSARPARVDTAGPAQVNTARPAVADTMRPIQRDTAGFARVDTARPAPAAVGVTPPARRPDSTEAGTGGAAYPSGTRASGPAPDDTASATSTDTAPTASADTASATPTAGSGGLEGVPHFTRPKHVRGLYVNAWAAGSARRIDSLIALAGRTEINTFVIDMKDASGYVSYRSQVPMAKEIGADGQIRIHNLPGLLRRLKRDGIYPIARIVVVKDPVLTTARPDLAIHDTAGQVFRDDKGIVWVNPYSRTVWKYDVALAKEVARMGFPEIQWDYLRFPDIPEDERDVVVYPGADKRTKAQVIGDFMRYARDQLRPLGVRMTVDVFGVTASATRDVGIGQVWTSFIGKVDVAQPMVYPSHWWKGSFGYETPNAYPYEVVRQALADALRQSAEVPGAGAVRPWLQDFTLGKPAYGAPEVRAQIQATYDSGIKEWFLWNPGSNYTESALKPKGGFTGEPQILVDSHIVPVSQRWEFVDSATGMDRAQPDTAAARDRTVVCDTMIVGDTAMVDDTAIVCDTTVVPDTTIAPDTTVRPDTTVKPATTIKPDTTVKPDTTRLGRLLARSRGASSSARARHRTR